MCYFFQFIRYFSDFYGLKIEFHIWRGSYTCSIVDFNSSKSNDRIGYKIKTNLESITVISFLERIKAAAIETVIGIHRVYTVNCKRFVKKNKCRWFFWTWFSNKVILKLNPTSYIKPDYSYASAMCLAHMRVIRYNTRWEKKNRFVFSACS